MQFARATALFWAAAAAQSVPAADADDGQSPRRLLMMDDFDFNNGFNNDFNNNIYQDDLSLQTWICRTWTAATVEGGGRRHAARRVQIPRLRSCRSLPREFQPPFNATAAAEQGPCCKAMLSAADAAAPAVATRAAARAPTRRCSSRRCRYDGDETTAAAAADETAADDDDDDDEPTRLAGRR